MYAYVLSIYLGSSSSASLEVSDILESKCSDILEFKCSDSDMLVHVEEITSVVSTKSDTR